MRKGAEARFSMKQSLCASTAVVAWVLASAMPAPVAAADLSIAPIYKAPPSPVVNWTGSYVGLSGGGAWGEAVVRNDVTGAEQTPRIDLGGGIIGITSGINVQSGPMLLGIESDTSLTGKEGTASQFPPNDAFNNEIKERWLSTFRGRLGYAQDNWLMYATAGGALASVHNSIIGPPGTISERHWHWGWTAGAGLEVKLSHDWSAKVEYLYVGLQDKSYFSPAPSLAFPGNQQLHIDDHIVRVGVNYKLPWNVLDPFFRR
jgi:outer membrane immunogenic protein